MPTEPGLHPDYSVYYGGTHFNFHSMAVECTPENFGSEDEVVFIRETYVISGVLLQFQQPGGQTNIHGAFDRAREDLMTKRLRFVVKVGGVTIVDHGAANDFDGGPTPKSLKLTEFTGELAALVSWTVEIARPFDVDNPYFAAGQGPPWHTYIQTVEIDDRFLTTRVIRGSARRATRMLGGDARWVESQHKRPAGFKRTRKWNLVRAGHQIDYEITDREIYLAFPKPVTNGKATFQVGRKQVGGEEGAEWKSIKHLSATYEAPKGVAKRQLAALLLLLAVSRFRLLSQNWPITSMSFGEDIFGGQISLDIVAEARNASQKSFQDEVDRTLGKDVPRAGRDVEDRGPWGTANLNPFTGSSPAPAGPGWTPAGPDPGTKNVNTTEVAGTKKKKPDPRIKLFRRFGQWVINPKDFELSGPGSAFNLFSFDFGESAADLRVVQIYRTERRIAVLKPKARGVRDIVQEVANPDMTITEIGRASFVGEVPDNFPPAARGVVEVQEVRPGLPVQDAAGQWIVPVSWMRRAIIGSV